MEELEKTTSRILEITLQIAELENEIAVAKKKCDEATEKEAVTSTGETLEETKGESIEAPAEENNIEATEKVLEEKELKANTNFKDKYTNELYEKDTIFVISETTKTKKRTNRRRRSSAPQTKKKKTERAAETH